MLLRDDDVEFKITSLNKKVIIKEVYYISVTNTQEG